MQALLPLFFPPLLETLSRMGKGWGKTPQRCGQSAREKRIFPSPECDIYPGRSPKSAQEGAVGAGPGCGEPSRPAGAGAAPAGWRGSSTPPLCQGGVCLERLMCYFSSISTHCTVGKRGPLCMSTVKYPARETALPAARGLRGCLNLPGGQAGAVGAPRLCFLGKPGFILLPG